MGLTHKYKYIINRKFVYVVLFHFEINFHNIFISTRNNHNLSSYKEIYEKNNNNQSYSYKHTNTKQ